MGIKIISLTAENFKRLQAVEIVPDGTFNVIAGNNEQGKSSLLDAIAFAIGGKDAIPDTKEIIQRGKTKAEVHIDLGDLVVVRTVTPSGQRLQVSGKDGRPMPGPQAVMDALISKISFDPLSFMNMKEAQQTETLLKLLDIDVQEYKKKRQEAFDSRTIVNRDVKRVKANLDSAPVPEKPATLELKDVKEVTDRLVTAKQQVKDHEARVKRKAELKEEYPKLTKRVEELKAELAAAEAKVEDCKTEHNTLHAQIKEYIAPDVEAIQAEVSGIDAFNDAIRTWNAYQELEAEYTKYQSESDGYTTTINSLDKDVQDKIAKAKMPVTGLTVVDEVIRYNDVPLAQCSQAIRVKVSMAIAMAMNPKLRVILIREGAFFDTNNLKLIAEMAKENDYQVWIERVGDGETGIIIEDGTVKGSPAAAPAPAPKKGKKADEAQIPIEEFPIPAQQEESEDLL